MDRRRNRGRNVVPGQNRSRAPRNQNPGLSYSQIKFK